jgi:hypothetical protein
MSWSRRIVSLGAIALLGGCAPDLSESEIQAIARDAPAMISNHPAPSIIEPKEWPPSIAALNPEAVFVSVDGLYVVTASFLTSQWGVFVPCSPRQRSPDSGSDPTYTPIAEGVYTFHIAG